jgi:hypothetical protein
LRHGVRRLPQHWCWNQFMLKSRCCSLSWMSPSRAVSVSWGDTVGLRLPTHSCDMVWRRWDELHTTSQTKQPRVRLTCVSRMAMGRTFSPSMSGTLASAPTSVPAPGCCCGPAMEARKGRDLRCFIQ